MGAATWPGDDPMRVSTIGLISFARGRLLWAILRSPCSFLCFPDVECLRDRVCISPEQDWRNMADRGHPVPTLHLVWCCRELDEMELLGESLPSLTAPAASATRGSKEPLVTLSLFCSGEMASARASLG